jgi:hypothetical protein
MLGACAAGLVAGCVWGARARRQMTEPGTAEPVWRSIVPCLREHHASPEATFIPELGVEAVLPSVYRLIASDERDGLVECQFASVLDSLCDSAFLIVRRQRTPVVTSHAAVEVAGRGVAVKRVALGDLDQITVIAVAPRGADRAYCAHHNLACAVAESIALRRSDVAVVSQRGQSRLLLWVHGATALHADENGVLTLERPGRATPTTVAIAMRDYTSALATATPPAQGTGWTALDNFWCDFSHSLVWLWQSDTMFRWDALLPVQAACPRRRLTLTVTGADLNHVVQTAQSLSTTLSPKSRTTEWEVMVTDQRTLPLVAGRRIWPHPYNGGVLVQDAQGAPARVQEKAGLPTDVLELATMAAPSNGWSTVASSNTWLCLAQQRVARVIVAAPSSNPGHSIELCRDYDQFPSREDIRGSSRWAKAASDELAAMVHPL